MGRTVQRRADGSGTSCNPRRQLASPPCRWQRRADSEACSRCSPWRLPTDCRPRRSAPAWPQASPRRRWRGVRRRRWGGPPPARRTSAAGPAPPPRARGSCRRGPGARCPRGPPQRAPRWRRCPRSLPGLGRPRRRPPRRRPRPRAAPPEVGARVSAAGRGRWRRCPRKPCQAGSQKGAAGKPPPCAPTPPLAKSDPGRPRRRCCGGACGT
mmetsp:Transcript_21791/g.61866  ORF Transcript_21791/g.61866 Transcript_21791/m.61866 type:complete len:211 (+) Transcript_21791:253-885(+)